MSTRHADDFFGGWQLRNDTAVRSRPEPVPSGAKRRRLIASGAALAVVGGAVIAPFATAGADPSAHTWWRLRECESSNRYYLNTGNGHYGAYQFDLATWRSVGGSGYPNQASKAEQDARALILYRERGWEPWQCAGILGLRPDKDAGSGRIGDIHVPSGHRHSHGVPAFPGGSHDYFYGDWNAHIKTFQNELHHRGFFPPGTGQYGPKTLHAVKRLQRLNGLPVTGLIGPNTWRLAWVGRYVPPGTGRPRRHRVPAFPGGSHWYVFGDWNAHIKTFQNELHRRGYFPPGTGQYGPKTLHTVKRLQRLNGLPVTGYIGPNTWRLAWVGKYRRG